MSQVHPNLWSEVTSFDNLWLAFKKAARGKRSKSTVAEFEFNLEPNLIQLQQELREGGYQP